MSLFSDVSMLNNALRTFQSGLNVTSNNIANAATPGYSRQVLGLGSLPVVYDGNRLGLGSGVDATGIQRVRDTFLDTRIKYELSELGRASIKKELLTELAAIFPEVAASGSTAGLDGAIANVAAKWTALAAAPGSVTAKTDVQQALKGLADMLQSDARKTFDLQVRVNDQVKQTVSQINDLLDQIASINTQIKALGSVGRSSGQTNVLQDLREQAAEKLAKLVDADFRVNADGQMSVNISVGSLVQGGKANHLITINSPTDPGRSAVGYTEQQGAAARNVSGSIHGGQLGALLSVRDGEIERARLDLDRIAFGIISRTNEINRTYTATDATTDHSVFLGSSAADIILNPIVAANPDYIGDTRYAGDPGDLAKIQSQLTSFIQYSSIRTSPGSSLGPGPIDPTATLGSQVFLTALIPTLPAAQGQFVISAGGNAVAVNWDQTQTLDEIIANINAAGGGSSSFYATFDKTNQALIIVGEDSLQVYDTVANFAEVMNLGSVVTSSAPINNYPVPGAAANQVDNTTALNTTSNLLNLFTDAISSGGTILIDGTPVNWAPTDSIAGISFNMFTLTASPKKVNILWDPNTQTVSLSKSGDPALNPGAQNYGLGNSMEAIQVVDKKGNLTRVLNIDTNTNSSKILDELIVDLGSGISAEDVLAQQAQALVDQSQTLQDDQSKVDLNAELAQAKLYQRSYEASVRMQFILDEILNVLINHTGTSSSSSSSI